MSTDYLAPLTEQDRSILYAKKKPYFVYTLLTATGAVAVLLPFILVRTLYWIIALPFFSLVLAFAAVRSILNLHNVRKDLAQGQKIVITAIIDDQDVDVSRSKGEYGEEGPASYNFWVSAGGRKLEVTEEQYYQLKKGDQIEAEVAPTSGVLFRINKFSEIA